MADLQQFNRDAEARVFDRKERATVQHNIAQYNQAVASGKSQYARLDVARSRAAVLRNRVIENLDRYLIDFETNFTRRGGKVIWAQDAEEAGREILELLKSRNVKSVVKSKSMVTEEIGLNDLLKRESIGSVETDLGEFIQQTAGEAPYHIVTPAMHKSKEDVAQLYHSKFGTDENLSPSKIMQWTRSHIRSEFHKAGAGITGANFLIAETGSVAITENEGNAWMSFAAPDLHIVITGIEKIIPSLADLDIFWPLLATYGTGQKMTVYNSVVNGPAAAGESGPKEMVVVLIDNGRSNLLAQTEQRRALSCIRCGACLNACPVFENVGGHTYDAVYSGPIGSVVMQHLKPEGNYRHLSFATTSCGKCTEVCPVNIDIHQLLQYNRRESVQQGPSSKTESMMWFFWKGAMMKRSNMDKGGAKLKNFMLRQFFRKSWGERRELPVVAQKTFNQMWKERKGIR
ncbi:MAG: lactate utilization protein [Bacteroidia bacterium]|nr:lactate utilization protein [Bacteroidia bacterium]